MDMELKFMLLPAAAPLLMVASFAPIVLYIVARWRAHRDPAPDPQLGLKFVIYYFATVGFHLALVGGTLLLYTMIRPGGEDSESKSQMYRMAFGFIVPAGVVLGAHIALLVRTNDHQFPGVNRLRRARRRRPGAVPQGLHRRVRPLRRRRDRRVLHGVGSARVAVRQHRDRPDPVRHARRSAGPHHATAAATAAAASGQWWWW
jgi:hypothetical protein